MTPNQIRFTRFLGLMQEYQEMLAGVQTREEFDETLAKYLREKPFSARYARWLMRQESHA